MLGLPPPRTSGGEPSHRDRTRQGMLTKSWRRKPGEVLAVLTVLTSLTGLAQAQQNGLFPLQPIRRERVPCPERGADLQALPLAVLRVLPAPVETVPHGMAPEESRVPNRKAELEKQPVLPIAPIPPEGRGRGPWPGGAGGRRAIPNPPPENERSPFEMDRPDNGAQPAPGGGPARRPATTPVTPPADNEPSPFDTPAAKPADAGAAPRPGPRAPQPTRPAPRLPDAGAPDLDRARLPARAPGTSRNDSQGESATANDRGPLLAMPDATLPPVEEAGAPGQPTTTAATESVLGGPAASAPVANPADSQPQPRRSRLSSLFGGLGQLAEEVTASQSPGEAPGRARPLSRTR